jgi:hypothetical protein
MVSRRNAQSPKGDQDDESIFRVINRAARETPSLFFGPAVDVGRTARRWVRAVGVELRGVFFAALVGVSLLSAFCGLVYFAFAVLRNEWLAVLLAVAGAIVIGTVISSMSKK